MKFKWLLFSSTWHAWEFGANVSVCGMVRYATGAMAEDCTDRLLPEQIATACKTCRKGVGHELVDNGLIPGPTTEAAWLGYLNRFCKAKHVKPPKYEYLEEIAKRLTLIGSPSDPEAVLAYGHICTLLLTPFRFKNDTGRTVTVIARLAQALEKLPSDRKSLLRVVAAMDAWKRITRSDKPGAFQPDTVVETIMALPDDVEPYIKTLLGRGFKSLAQIFHPTVLEIAKRDPELRGVFSGSSDYWQKNLDRLGVTD